MKRRQLITKALQLGAGASLWIPAHSQAPARIWPTDNVKLIVPFPAGGGTDRLARLIAQRMGEQTGYSFVVENKPGAGGNIAAAQVARSGDPHALLFTTTAIAVSPFIYAKLGYSLAKDLQPIIHVSSSPLVLVVKDSSPITNIDGVAKVAASKLGGLNYGSPGVGTTSHLGGFMLTKKLKMSASHVAYRGAGQAINALIAGEIDFSLMAAVSVLPFVRNKLLRAVAVAGKRPLADLTEIPLMGNAPYNLDFDNWQGILISSAVAKPSADAMNAAFNQVIRLQDVRTAVYADGATPVGGTGLEFKNRVTLDGNKYGGIVISAGIKPE